MTNSEEIFADLEDIIPLDNLDSPTTYTKINSTLTREMSEKEVGDSTTIAEAQESNSPTIQPTFDLDNPANIIKINKYKKQPHFEEGRNLGSTRGSKCKPERQFDQLNKSWTMAKKIGYLYGYANYKRKHPEISQKKEATQGLITASEDFAKGRNIKSKKPPGWSATKWKSYKDHFKSKDKESDEASQKAKRQKVLDSNREYYNAQRKLRKNQEKDIAQPSGIVDKNVFNDANAVKKPDADKKHKMISRSMKH